MKNILLIINAVLLVSCNYLSLEPEDNFTSVNYWKNESQLETFMNGLHNNLRADYFNFYLLGEARGGTQRIGSASQGNSLDNVTPIKDNTFTSGQTGLTNWVNFYQRILYLNTFIINVENRCDFLSNEKRTLYLGQAYGLRSFYYFWLYRTFGGVPKLIDDEVIQGKSDPTYFYNKRMTAKETLDFIKEDIFKSITYFNKRNIVGTRATWSLGASLMLKTEVYLWSGKVSLNDQIPALNNSDLIEARNSLIQLDELKVYSLEDNFEKVFNSSNKGGKEIIFSIRFKEGEAENVIHSLYQINAFVGNAFDISGKRITTDVLDMRVERQQRHEYLFSFWRSFDSKDNRRDITFYAYYKGTFLPPNLLIKSDSGTLMRKYMGIINTLNTRIYESDIPIYRYAEALLLRAEIENALNNDPTPYLNQVRRRAFGLNPIQSSIYDFINVSFEQNELNILSERDKEFVWENKRWFDICRMKDKEGNPLVFSSKASYIISDFKTGTKKAVLDKNIETYKLLWPIDVNTLSRNPQIENNPGYN